MLMSVNDAEVRENKGLMPMKAEFLMIKHVSKFDGLWPDKM
jgi:hypothetical protein